MHGAKKFTMKNEKSETEMYFWAFGFSLIDKGTEKPEAANPGEELWIIRPFDASSDRPK
jgi:hypothetical protein